MKIFRSIVATLIFLLLLIIFYYIHINYIKVDVVFYAAIADGVLAATLTSVALIFFNYLKPLCVFEKFQLFIIWLIASYALAISLPTVIDRSLSFYILEKIQQRGGGIQKNAFEQVFTQEYVKEHRLVDVRLTEQLQSGTIVIKNNCVFLTPRGKEIAAFSRYFRLNLLPKKRLLMNEYTDVLTDPFINSVNNLDYICN